MTSPSDSVSLARRTLLEGVGAEVAESFPGITRLGGQVVAALYLADESRSMDQLSEELGRAKSNIFVNLRALEEAGIVTRNREKGERFDTYRLRGKYPDVIIGAYLSRLKNVVADKQSLVERASSLLGDEEGPEARNLRDKLALLSRAYGRFARVFELLPQLDGPVDLERLFELLPAETLASLVNTARQTLDVSDPPLCERRDIAGVESDP